MKEYLVKKVQNEAICEVKKGTKTWWSQANMITDLSSPWQKELPPLTQFRALWDDSNFYFQFIAFDQDILKKSGRLKLNNPIDNDRVELFFRTDDKMNPYYCFEIDPHANVLKFRASLYKNFDYEWDWNHEVSEIMINSEIHVDRFVVEGSFDLESLKKMNLLNNRTLDVGVFRAVYSNENSEDVTWLSWVKPDSEEPDFHISSSFGKFKLIEE